MSFVQQLICHPSMHPSNSQRFIGNFKFQRDFVARLPSAKTLPASAVHASNEELELEADYECRWNNILIDVCTVDRQEQKGPRCDRSQAADAEPVYSSRCSMASFARSPAIITWFRSMTV